ncbi:uncharacterized protein N7483_003155 [Penicillium malachiteum]|uniref:uncharacterized protein n=1 Tax=Penicillium malachiteum TaxID=1324776 RepID=UPI002546F3F2|nr:uncharacterized protein N7483_003155 [Penicillium malachiteum]KAJ5728647.1 hypothetical protein N7483_003155 [Penicillium malachiteum]
MPMKLNIGFGRRKSSGNILEDVESRETQSQSSFRVYERPGPQRSMTDGAPLTQHMSEGTVPLGDSDNIFAEPGQPTDRNRSTSTRLSSSSTQPSSTEVPSPNETSPHSRIHDVPPPISAAIRAAGRTFSFGGRFSSSTPSAPRNAPVTESSRQRAMTTSTDETATPPKLSHAQLDLGGDDFGKMFDTLEKRQSASLRDPSPRRDNQSQSESQNSGRAHKPMPINTDRSTVVEPSPYSWNSHDSGEGLLQDPDDIPLGLKSPTLSSPQTTIGYRERSPVPQQMTSVTATHSSLQRPKPQYDGGLRRSIIYSGDRDSSGIDDEDAAMVRNSLLWSKDTSPQPRWSESASPSNAALVGKSQASSPRENLSPGMDSMFSNPISPRSPTQIDSSVADHARLAVKFAESLPKSPSPGNKVMTPSQFEHYRQQQELQNSNSDSSDAEDKSDDDAYDEEDEAERQREAEKQRRKREAHLSVYRQQMQKVIGQQSPSPSPSLRPVMSGASNSTPNLLMNRSSVHLSSTGEKSSSGKSNEDEDDEVPLAILAAHGFPNRNRPPTRLTNVSSNPNLRASMMHPYISSSSSLVGGEQENRGSLPVFARNLPRDPYFGASLVNPTNRESLALGGGSSYGGPGATPPVPTGGLVGIIAQEEQSRKLRRGSPNTQAMYDMGSVPRPYSMMSPPPQPTMTASEQAQVQLTNHMSTMMQVQIEWMQQMMRMQGVPGATPQMMPPGMPPGMLPGMPMPHMTGAMSMPGTSMGPPPMGVPHMPGPGSVSSNPNMRPVSMPGLPPSTPPNYDPRPLSMLDPNLATRRTGSPMPNIPGGPFPHNSPGYAASIAPSERSTAGMASRYRPVSMQGEHIHQGSPLNNSWNDENRHHSHLSISQSHGALPKSASLATVTVRPVSRGSQAGSAVQKPSHGSDEENDDEAWAEMRKNREKKKSSWKLKRGTSSFGDLLGAVH